MEDGVGSGGITYGGEVVQNATPGDDPTRGIEIPFEDENFLVKATSKNPPSIFERVTETLGNVGKGAYSWPFDYTLCIHWIAGYAGLYGPTVQRTCEYHKDRILSLIEASFRVVYYLVFRGVLLKIMGNETTRSLISDSLDAEGRAALAREIADRLPELQDGMERTAGRWASGGFFTRWMDQRMKGRGGGKLVAVNTVMLFWGSAIHSSIKHPGDFGLIELFVAWINGDADYQVESDVYKEIFGLAQRMSEHLNSESLGEDYETYLQVMQQIRDFGSSGGAVR